MATPQPKSTKHSIKLNTLKPNPLMTPLLQLLKPIFLSSKAQQTKQRKSSIKKNIKTIFKPLETLKQISNFVKDKTNPLHHQGVYKIPCSCSTSYIAQIRRSFETRLKEHMVDTHHNRTSKQTIAEHSFKTKHLIQFDQTQILGCDSYYYTHLIREALKIENKPNDLNKKDGLKISQSEAPIINKISNICPIINPFSP